MLWLRNNTVLQNSSGQVVDTDTCCCNDCPQCDALGSEMQVEFLADLNGGGDAAGCAASCADWIAAWTMKLLTPDQVTNLFVTYPTTFPPAFFPRDPNDNGCWYGLFTGLPCGANFMAAEILDGGGDGLAVMRIVIGWADGVFVAITCTHNVPVPSKDCIANLTREDESPGVTGNTPGISFGGAVPCDFTGVLFSPNEMVLTMLV